jgi:TP901 family phage tail tape measure protein
MSDINVQIGADASQAYRDVANFQKAVASKQIEIPLAGLDNRAGNILQLNDAMLAQINITKSLKTEYAMLEQQDPMGNWVSRGEVALRVTQQLSDATNTLVAKQVTFQRDAMEGQRLVPSRSITFSPLAEAKKLETEYGNTQKAIDGMIQKAREWEAKSHNMSGQGVDDAKATIREMETLARKRDEAYAGKAYDDARKYGNQITELNNKLKVQEAALSKISGSIRSWGEAMKNAIKQTVVYTLTIGSVRAALDQVKQGMQYILELNNEMTKIRVLQVEGASSPEEINKLALSYNALAKEMGVTTLEVASGSVEWLRQGKSIEETQTLLRSTLMLSKLGNLDSAQSTEYLTAITNGFKISAEDTVTVVDKLVAVDNIAATSAGELATAMRYTSVTAQQAGVTLEQLISYIGTVSSVTRASAESIGQSFKTMFARMQDIRLGKIDEEGIGINNVEKALADVGIELRDSQDEFRNMGDVLQDIAGKWDGMTETQQAYIGKTIAGIRQIEYFKVLMANMSMAYKYQDAQLESAGLAYDRYQIYLESAEAAQNRLKASVEGLWQTSITSKGMIQFYNALSKIIDLIAGSGGLIPVLVLATSVVAAFHTTEISSFATGLATLASNIWQTVVSLTSMETAALAAAEGTTVLKVALSGLTITTGGWVAIIGVAIAGIMIAYNWFSKADERLQTSIDNTNRKISELESALDQLGSAKDSVRQLWEEYEKLNAIVERTDEQQKQLNDTIRSIIAIYPDLQRYYDDEGNLHIANTQTRQMVIDAINKQILANQELLRIEALLSAKTLEKQYAGGEDAVVKAERYLKLVRSQVTMGKRPKEDIETYKLQLEAEIAKQESLKSDIVQKMLGLSNPSDRKAFLSNFSGEMRTELENVFKATVGSRTDNRNAVPLIDEKATEQELKQSLKDYKGFIDALGRLNKGAKGLKLADVFAGSQKDAQKFMANLLDEARETFNGIDQAYQQGDLSATEYLDSVNNISDTYTSLFEDILANAEDLNIPQDVVEQLKNAIIDLKTEQEALAASSTFAAQAQGATYDSMKAQGIEAFTSLAQAAYNTGVTIPSSFGTGVQQIAAYIQASGGNFDAFIAYMATQTKNHIIDMVNTANQGAAVVASVLGNSGSLVTGGFGGYSGGIGGGSSGGGGGGGGQKNKAEIDALNEKKKAIKDLVDEFKKWIDAQKEMLRLQKEEKEFNEELLKKEQALAKTKTRIALLALDDSEAAKAERLKLEEDAADQELDINKDKEDRIYDLKIEELDAQYEKYKEDMDKQIELIDTKISRLQKEQSSVGGVGKSYSGLAVTATTALKQVMSMLDAQGLVTDKNRKKVEEIVKKFLDAKMSAEEAYKATMKLLNAGRVITDSSGRTGIDLNGDGRVDRYHEGGFVGDLKSNEEFAKLLDGELVVTQQQMYKFMSSTLPKITSMGGGNMSISMPINVAGNLDKSVLPDLQDMVEKTMVKINGNMKRRGHVRQTNLVGI